MTNKPFVERDRVRFEQVTPRERTGASDGFDQLRPKLLQVTAGAGRARCRARFVQDHGGIAARGSFGRT